MIGKSFQRMVMCNKCKQFEKHTIWLIERTVKTEILFRYTCEVCKNTDVDTMSREDWFEMRRGKQTLFSFD